MDGHLNREGNAIVGHVLARAIEKEFF